MCLFRVDLEQRIDVAEAGRPNRDAVLEKQERAAGAGAGQYRRANGRQVLLAATATEPDTGYAGQQLVHVMMLDGLEQFGIEPLDIAGMQQSRLFAALARDDEFLYGLRSKRSRRHRDARGDGQDGRKSKKKWHAIPHERAIIISSQPIVPHK